MPSKSARPKVRQAKRAKPRTLQEPCCVCATKQHKIKDIQAARERVRRAEEELDHARFALDAALMACSADFAIRNPWAARIEVI